MSQTYQVPTSGTALSTDVTNISNSLEALRCTFSGSSAPSSPAAVAGQLYYNTSSGLYYQYDGSAWNALALKANRADRLVFPVLIGAVSATGNFLLLTCNVNLTVEKVKLISDTSTTSTGTNHWTIQIRNVTGAVNLRSASYDTNGNEFTANTVKDLGVDQNLSVAANDVLRIEFTKNASATNMASVLVQIEAVPR